LPRNGYISMIFTKNCQNDCTLLDSAFDSSCAVPEIMDPVFAKTSQNARFLLSENERFGLVFVKTGSINSGTGVCGIVTNLKQRQHKDNHLTDHIP
jgi:hypothetical protein